MINRNIIKSSIDLNETNENCPVCKSIGISVSKVTVENLVTEDNHSLIDDDKYRICMNEDCDVAYYSVDNSVKFLKDQIKVPIWFKKDAKPKYACYCSKVTEEDVIEAVVKHGAKTVKGVNSITGAMTKPNCKKNNPMGVCCHNIIQTIINENVSIK